jgi:UMP-CMP kinase
MIKPIVSKKDEMTVIFVLGGPGAGKGTQCELLVREFGFVHISAGDLLRKERERPGSPFGKLINDCIKEGRIVPKEITISLIQNVMSLALSKQFLIDGFPRQMDQAECFEQRVCESTCMLYFECPETLMEQRLLKRGETSARIDDSLDVIRKRFQTFRETTMPVISHYEKQGKLYRIDATAPINDVFDQVKKICVQFIKC